MEKPSGEAKRSDESTQRQPPILVPIAEAARSLGVSVRQIYALAQEPEFPRPRYIDSRPRWLWEDLRAFALAAPTRPPKTRAPRPPGSGA